MLELSNFDICLHEYVWLWVSQWLEDSKMFTLLTLVWV